MSNHFVAEFERTRTEARPEGRAAISRFAELGFPHTGMEEWRFTNVAPIAQAPLPVAAAASASVARGDIERLGLAPGLVFVDGYYRADLSEPPAGIRTESLAAALAAAPDLVRAHLGRYADAANEAFVALNAAFFADGAFVHLPRGFAAAAPIHLLFVATDRSSFPRNLYVAEEGAQAQIVEHYVSLGGERHFTDVVTEAFVARNAHLEVCRLQLENEAAQHVSTVQVHQERDSSFLSHNITLGGALTRNDLNVGLDGENVRTTLNGLFLTRGEAHVDNHTRLEHRKPHGESHELYKGILADRSSGVFSGKIHVFEDAQKTDAKQSSANLLLSDEAVIDTKPQLEIYADDVKCTHGAVVGQLDPSALFYLRARGIGEDTAHRMLIRAFAGDITSRIGVAEARERVERMLERRLPGV